MRNKNLKSAKRAKRDEFYTQLRDIENELKHYKSHFRNKVVYCNCDDPKVSNFFHYFSYNFEELGLKKLITTCYKNRNVGIFRQHKELERAAYIEYTGDKNDNLRPDPEEIEVKYLEGDGDFRSRECVELLKTANIIVTGPPFSLFREYLAQLVQYNKKFLIVGNKNALTYKEVFPLIKENKVWLGMGSVREFEVPNGNRAKATFCSQRNKWFQKFGNVGWFTNLSHSRRNEELILTKKYTSDEFPHYDNYDAIEVSKVKDIPKNGGGYMGVPITFLDKYNPEQFEIIGLINSNSDSGIKELKKYDEYIEMRI
ncbi:MAG: restriction endonuclease subunit M, partial [Flavobacteriaceae bacterium]|nr:restriction endonuclease subunit M [Flavobacteriaceae bacterium]